MRRHDRLVVDNVSDTFIRVIARYGFMETPSIPKILEHCKRKDLNIEIAQTSFFLSRRTLRPAPSSIMPRWQDRLFIALSRSANDATDYFQIPTGRVVEVGTQVTIGGYGGRSVTERAIASSIVLADGRELFVAKPGN